MTDFLSGDIVSGLEPDEHVEIRRVAPFGNRTLIEGVTVTSRREIRRPLSAEELARLVKVRGSEYTFDGDARAFMLGVEAHRIRIAYQFDPLFAVNSSVVDVLPHQVEAVYRYLLPLPRIRFLLADDTGAGKTIMAGLLIKELLFRGVISKVLIITPGGLTKQWQEDEMRAKFGLEFDLVNRASFEAKPGQFSQSDEGLFVTSIDFISRHEGCLNAARETQWDMIVVDEAHKLSAFEYGIKVNRSERYQAVEALASRTDHLLFLTATPHRGRKDTFRRLLMLLDEDLFQKDELVTERIHEAVAAFSGPETFEGEAKISKARNRFFLRRLKEEMVNWDSEKLFKQRHTQTTGYELTPQELELYNAVTKYVRSRRKQAKERKNRNVELTLMVMQRRLASSIYAITRTLQNRLDALNEVLTILKDPSRASERRRVVNGNGDDVPQSFEEYEELDENQREGGERIISLQTSFGGGKTHSLVALWHLARHIDVIKSSAACADVRKALGKSLPKKVSAVAVFTNQTCDPVQGRQTPSGIHTRTMWGELTLQLGGTDLYKEVEANDQSQASPKGVYAKILQRAAPCLILLDELADYCVSASAIKVVDSNLADQTISFIQELTEAASQVSGVAVVATLPASFTEVASSERGQEILDSLERRFGRMSSDLRPVADEEIYEVVRRRLFESLGEPAEQKKVVDAYLKMYAQHPNELPTEAGRGIYRDRMLQSYPFHPSLIDAFYLRWGSHNQFQRTRGVLRLLASIVGDLWQRRNTETQSQGLIQGAHIHWSIDALHSALTRLWGAGFETVISADVIGEKANAPLLDEERGEDYQREKIAQGLAAAILLGSFGGQGERAGFSTKDLKLAVSRPDYNWGYIDGALLEFENRTFYMHFPSAGNLGKRYWFDTKPTLTNLLVRYRQQFSTQNFDSEIISLMDEQAHALPSTNWRVLVDPEQDLPEQKALSLLVLPPDCAYSESGSQPTLVPSTAEQRILSLSKKCGTRDRLYRNTLLFLLPSNRGLLKLRNALIEVSALETVKRDYGAQLDSEQTGDLTTRLEKARKGVTEALGPAYPYIARIESDRVAVLPISDVRATLSDHLSSAWHQIVDEEEWVLKGVGIVTLQNVGLVPKDGGIRIKDAIEAFLRYTDKPMIASRDAVLEGLRQACSERVIGIARGTSLNNLQRKWCGDKNVALDPNEEGLWIIPPFEPEPESAGKPVDTAISPTTTTGGAQASPTTDTTKRTTGKLGQPASNPIRKLRIKGIVDLSNWADVFRSFVSPAARMNLKHLRLGIDFELEPPDDKPLDANDPAVKAMKESARQLGVDLEEE